MFGSQVLGIDIGSLNTKIVAGIWNGKNLHLKRTFMVPTPEGSVKDGYIVDLHKLEDALRPILQDNRLQKNEVVFSAESTEIILREIVLPWVPEKELRGIIPFEVEKHFPIRVQDYALEYQVLEEFNKEGIKNIRLLVAAMPREMVESYMELTKGLNLKPLGLELQAGNITSLFLRSGQINGAAKNPSHTTALVDIGHAKLRVTFVSQSRVSFSRTVPVRGINPDQVLAEALDISREKARQLKEQGTLLPSSSEGQDQEAVKIREVLLEKADDWVQELQPLFRYYLGLMEENKIDQILIYGGYSEIPGIAEYIQDVFNRPTLAIRDLEVIINTPKNTDASLQYFLNAAGSLIQE